LCRMQVAHCGLGYVQDARGPDFYIQRAGTKALLLRQPNGGLRRTSCRISLVVPHSDVTKKNVGLADFKLAVLPPARRKKVVSAADAADDIAASSNLACIQTLSPRPPLLSPSAAVHTPRQLALHDFVARQVLPSIPVAKNKRHQNRRSIDPVDFSDVLGSDAELRWKLTRLRWPE